MNMHRQSSSTGWAWLVPLVLLLGVFGAGCAAEDSATALASDPVIRITADGYVVGPWDGIGPVTVVNEHAIAVGARIYRLDEGATADSLFLYLGGGFPGAPPFHVVGGVETVAPGATASVEGDLPAGRYLVASFEPDDDAGWVPQFMTGHLAEFAVVDS